MRKPFSLAFAAFAFIAAVGFFKAGPVNTVAADDKDIKDNQAHVTVAHVFRSGEIIGMPVRNREGDNLGKIDDLVIDMKNGEVRLDLDPDTILDLLYGPLYIRLLLKHAPLNKEFVDTVFEIVSPILSR